MAWPRICLLVSLTREVEKRNGVCFIQSTSVERVMSSSIQVQVLYIMPLDHVKNSSYSGNSEARDGQANDAVLGHSGSGLSCACVDVAKTHLSPLAEEQYGSRNSTGNSPSTESSFDLNGVVSLRRRYGAEKSKYPVVRQPPEEILSRVLRETSTQESNSPLQHFKVSEIFLLCYHIFYNVRLSSLDI